ncbi:MAG: DUF4277 domain-containing protein [Clostridia bacterium]|nr:DUF4277 domain-containing protein [Clostridia bacterium]
MSVRAYSAGPAAMIGQVIRELGIVETVDSMVRWDPGQCRRSPGTHVLAMLTNVFMGRTALYRVDEFYELQDIAVLFGADASADDFNDSASGLYESSSPDDEVFFIAHGYNRDHRPDLKQFNYGPVVNGEGIPLLGYASDGNESDKVWNRRVIEELAEGFADHLTNLVYVANSAAVTKGNLDLIAGKGIRFISRLPATFAQPIFCTLARSLLGISGAECFARYCDVDRRRYSQGPEHLIWE